MITISLCMIVKNEEKNLSRCLDCLKDIMDEIIIVDTGSTDHTKQIASKYTDKIFDFIWCDDFSAARNFSFSKATMEYIYAPDADEYLDEENQNKLMNLKKVLLPEIEMVQMNYVTPDEYNTVQNFKREARPKLFKRLREFVWTDPIHETVRLLPIVYDSDIDIIHKPHSLHSQRDFKIFQAAYKKNGKLSEKVLKMYSRELYKCGDDNDFLTAYAPFKEHYELFSDDESACVLAHIYRIDNNISGLMSVSLKHTISTGSNACSEMCYELGVFYYDSGDYSEASVWLYNCCFETECCIDIEIKHVKGLKLLSQCYIELSKTLHGAEKENSLKLAEQYMTTACNFRLSDYPNE